MSRVTLTDIKLYNINNQYKNYKKQNRDLVFFRVGVLLRIVLIIFLLILLATVVWRVRGSNNTLTFTAFLEFLSNLNSVEIGQVDVSSFAIGGNWGIFDGLRNFFNVFSNLLGVLVWLGANVINVIRYIVAFVSFLFV